MKNRYLCSFIALCLLLPAASGGAAEETTPSTATVQRKLDEIIIESVNFDGERLDKVLQVLSEVSAEYDPSESGPRGVSIIGSSGRSDWPTVNLAARSLSLRSVLKLITEETDYRFDVRDGVVIVRPDDGTFNLNFPGGSVRDLIDLIEQQLGRLPNIVLDDSAAEITLPSMQLRSVDVDQVMSVASRLAVERHPDVPWNWRNHRGVWTISVGKGEETSDFAAEDSTTRTEIHNIREMRDRFSPEDIATAVEIVFELEGLSNEEGNFRIHEETGLLYVRGSQRVRQSIDMLMSELNNRRENDIPLRSDVMDLMERARRGTVNESDDPFDAPEDPSD